MTVDEINKLPKNYIRAEMKRRDISVKDICERLEKYDEKLNAQSFNNKMTRGNFSAVFFFKCMCALELNIVRLNDN